MNEVYPSFYSCIDQSQKSTARHTLSQVTNSKLAPSRITTFSCISRLHFFPPVPLAIDLKTWILSWYEGEECLGIHEKEY